MSATECDIAIVGAGPYGLAAAAHLHAADGLDIRVLGEPMSFWEKQMPQGMLLRSPYVASNIADPQRELTLDDFASEHQPLPRPLALEQFVDYGHWFQQQALPQLDSRQVARVDRNGSGFRLELGDGSSLHAARVVVAAGIRPFAWKPPQFRELPAELASHTSEHRELSQFAGRASSSLAAGRARSSRPRCCTKQGPRSRCWCAHRGSTSCAAPAASCTGSGR